MSSPLRIPPAIAAEIDRLATAVAKDPRSKDFLPLADEYIKAGMWQEAAAVLEDGLKVYPGFVTAMAALGRVYDQLGQAAKAKAILEEVVKQRPDNLRAHRILAKLYHAEGQAELVLHSCTAILNANPFDEEALALKRSVTGAPDDPPPSKRDKKAEETLGIDGTGLGLYLVRKIVEQHSGELIFSSEYGKGSTFGFRIPVFVTSALEAARS